jgi:uncharacterized protein (DUF433 family)
MIVKQRAALNQIVWTDPERMSGEPCFRNTRVPVYILLEHLESNATLEEFLAGFPSVTRSQAMQYIELSKLP